MKIGLALVLSAYIMGQFLSCSSQERNHYILGKNLQAAKSYEAALAEFEKGLEKDPDSILLTYEKARTLYLMEKWADAMPVYERFLELTDKLKETYGNERWDAEFNIKRCKQHLGLPTEDEPENGENSETPSETGNEDTIGGIHIETR